MRIALSYFCRTDAMTETGRYVKALSSAVAAAGTCHEFMLFLPQLPGVFANEPAVEKVPVSDLADLRRKIEERSPLDLIHHSSYSIWGAFALAPLALSLPIKTVVTLHNIIPLRYKEELPIEDQRMAALQIQLFASSAQRFIAFSDFTKEDVVQVVKIPRDLIDVIPEAAEPIFHPLNNKDLVAKSIQALNLPRPYILFVGCSARKNLEVAIRAMAILNRSVPAGLHLVVCANAVVNDEYQHKMEELATTTGVYDRLHFARDVSDSTLVALYNGAEAFLFPSRYEGFGLPVLEAMACGTPVVASNATSIPEVAGGGAVLRDPDDAEGFAGAIARILREKDFRQELCRKGFTQAQKFSWEQTARQTLTCYEKVARQAHPFQPNVQELLWEWVSLADQEFTSRLKYRATLEKHFNRLRKLPGLYQAFRALKKVRRGNT